MKRIVTSILAIGFALISSAGNDGKVETYTLEQKISKIEWIGKKVTGQHEGNITMKEGKVEVKDGMITGGMLIIDMNSITVTDIEDAGTNAKLKGHLMSDDFFGVKKHPTAMLKINKVEKIEGSNHHIHGELTLKGKTEKVEIPASILMENGKLVAVGEIEIDRTKFDIRYGSGQFFEGLGDKMIDDNFIVKFKVGAIS